MFTCLFEDENLSILFSAECDNSELIFYVPCTAVLPYMYAVFPSDLSNDQTTAVQAFRELPRNLRGCHPDFDLFICTQYFPGCPSTAGTAVRDPCRSLCQAVQDSCGEKYFEDTAQVWPFVCSTYPEDTCISITAPQLPGRSRRDVASSSLDINMDIVRKNSQSVIEFFQMSQLLESSKYRYTRSDRCIKRQVAIGKISCLVKKYGAS